MPTALRFHRRDTESTEGQTLDLVEVNSLLRGLRASVVNPHEARIRPFSLVPAGHLGHTDISEVRQSGLGRRLRSLSNPVAVGFWQVGMKTTEEGEDIWPSPVSKE